MGTVCLSAGIVCGKSAVEMLSAQSSQLSLELPLTRHFVEIVQICVNDSGMAQITSLKYCLLWDMESL